MAEHQPDLCKCSTASIHETANGPECSCPCQSCCELRATQALYWRVTKLQKRLVKANIDPEDLAFLVWLTLESKIEERIDKLAEAAVNRLLRDITLISQVRR